MVIESSRKALQKLRSRTVATAFVAVMVPTVFFSYIALKTPVAFDGAMNLQVAQNLSRNGEYSRNYVYVKSTSEEISTNTRHFPSEVETNGPYILVAAGSLRLFGENQVGYQFTNVLFILLLASVVWWVLRRWLLLSLIGPSLVLLSLPKAAENALGGMGEVPAVFFAVLSLSLISAAYTKEHRGALKFIGLSFLSAGAAVTTKTYLVGFLPALLFGLALLIYVNKLPLKKTAYKASYVLIFPAIYEAARFISLGSIQVYLQKWIARLHSIAFQAGVKPSTNPEIVDASSNIFEKALRQAGHFAQYTTIAPILLIAVTVLFLTIIYYLTKNKKAIRTSIKFIFEDNMRLLAIFLLIMFGTYFIWWSFILPESKMFVRRTYPAMIPLTIAIMILSGTILSSLATLRKSAKKSKRHGARVKPILLVGVIFVAVCIGSLGYKSVKTVARANDVPFPTIDEYKYAEKTLQDLPEDARLYGRGWWSSPVIDLMSERTFYNAELVDNCGFDPNRDFFVWDNIASAITGIVQPKSKGYEYVYYRDAGAAKIYRLKSTADCR